MSRHLFAVGAAIACAATPAYAQAARGSAAMPITTVAPGKPGTQLVMVVTGEAGHTDFETAMARELSSIGDGVLVLDSRTYLSVAKSPARVAADASEAIKRYSAAWNRPRLVLIGYSRGADVAPFIANRLTASVRGRLDGLVMISPSGSATFELTLRDVVTPRPRATDLPVMPELERLRGTPLVCAYGVDERSAFCTRLDSTLAKTVVRSGGHGLDASDGAEIARMIAEWLRR